MAKNGAKKALQLVGREGEKLRYLVFHKELKIFVFFWEYIHVPRIYIDLPLILIMICIYYTEYQIPHSFLALRSTRFPAMWKKNVKLLRF